MLSPYLTYLFLLGLAAVAAKPTSNEASLPQLDLPWGKWQASVFSNDSQIYTFQNVRFGAPPERFGAPAFPDWKNDSVQSSNVDISCIQINTGRLKTPPGGNNSFGAPVDNDRRETEDCLFLDIYAPASAFEPGAKPLPVIVWIHGGAYAFGGKNQAGPLYTGQSMLRASDYQAIFIAGNYRLGAFGWLAGDYMQKEGLPNAGLYDQALLLEWVQEYVSKVGGDPSRVSAWGESAGAGSILHHIIREDGTKDPLFKTFAVQSPAFEWSWDNSPGGKLDKVYKNFSRDVGCGHDFNISCLRQADESKLVTANQNLFANVRQTGLFPVGPSVDGKWVTSIPTVVMAKGHYWKGISSAIISHCANEAEHFTPNVTSEAMFNDFLGIFLPGNALEPQRDAIRQQYDCNTTYKGDYHLCLETMIRDASFTCNTRNLFDSYPSKSYMMQYAFPFEPWAYHASDLIALFVNDRDQAVKLLIQNGLDETLAGVYAGSLVDKVLPGYQRYFASFLLSGDPNSLAPEPALAWPIANGTSEQMSGVMQVAWAWSADGVFTLINDIQNLKSSCSFWTGIAEDIVSASGTETFGRPKSPWEDL